MSSRLGALGATSNDPVRIVFEREARFAPPAGLALPSFAGLPHDPMLAEATVGATYERRRDSRYYDTPELALADAGITVRRDHAGRGYDWRLVLTDDPTAAYPIRRQLHFSGYASPVPEKLLHYLAAHHRRHGLIPIASVTGIATVVPLLLPGSVTLGEVVDECTRARSGHGAGSTRQIAVTTPVLNAVGEAFLAAATATLLHVGCRLDLAAGDPFRFTEFPERPRLVTHAASGGGTGSKGPSQAGGQPGRPAAVMPC